MSFYQIYSNYKDLDFKECFASYSDNHVLNAIGKDILTHTDLMSLLSPSAEKHIEQMAQRAKRITFQYFGKAIVLYAPLYISDYCDNHCAYCGFNVENHIKRKKLSLEEIEQEAIAIASTGIRHLLILTGDSRKHSPVTYIIESIRILKKHFPSISVEIYALNEDEYKELIEAGVDGLTIYQETYYEDLYGKLHPAGPKKDYLFRLDAPERACNERMRSINVGALLGLTDWRKDVLFTLLHAEYLQNKYSDIEISVSFPRIQPHSGESDILYPVSDKHFVQAILAARLFLNRAGITISTRESANFRDNLIGLGVTRMSIGSKTTVGGYAKDNINKQFEISDDRDINTFKKVLLNKGYEPVLKDWQNIDVKHL